MWIFKELVKKKEAQFSSCLFRDFNLEETLKGVSAQICCELNKSLLERGYSALTPALQDTLTGQISTITQKDNPIRTLVGKISKAGIIGLYWVVIINLFLNHFTK